MHLRRSLLFWVLLLRLLRFISLSVRLCLQSAVDVVNLAPRPLPHWTLSHLLEPITSPLLRSLEGWLQIFGTLLGEFPDGVLCRLKVRRKLLSPLLRPLTDRALSNLLGSFLR